MKYFLIPLLLLIILVNTRHSLAESLNEVKLNEDQIILLDIVLNNYTVSRSIDAYQIDDKLLLAIEPLFDALKIRYVIADDTLSVWQGAVERKFTLNTAAQNQAPNGYLWASDDFYFFTELDLFKSFFPTKMEFLYKNLQLKITTGAKVAVFPVQTIAKQNRARELARFSTGSSAFEKAAIPITIADQYRLLTVPHGRVNIVAETNNTETRVNGSAQLTADFLYHSANLTLNDTNNSDLAARLVLSRYKTTPDEHILGLYDQYKLGDVSSTTNGISTATSGGIGLSMSRYPSDYRQTNQSITLQETAPPGWEAELFRNHIFLATTTVPANGLLTFDDVEVDYGINNYQIKLYGPFGETEIRKKDVDMTRNALTKGQLSHSIYGLDRNHRLIDDQSELGYGITDYGATFDYGVSDNWQVGFGFAGLENDQQFYNLKNAITMPGLLVENDLSLDQDGNYAQITTLKGSAFNSDRYSMVFQSADDFSSNRITATGQSLGFQGGYTRPTELVNINFTAGYQEDDLSEDIRVSNRLSGNIGPLRLRHSLSYYQNTQNQEGATTNTGIVGALGFSGSLPYDFRVSADIQYDPEADDPILNSSSILIQKSMRDPWDGYHSFNANYQPLATGSAASWRFSHRAAWQAESFQLNIATSYDESDKWSFQLGLQFFLGYDYRNNRLLLNQKIQSNSATLDVHTYLDRQLNGISDPLDYNLANVEFIGNPEWTNIQSGENGRTILPGVFAVTPFTFGARWKDGSNTINNDYAVYTHPGAYVEVNMPFVLSTELVGFVLRTKNGREIGLQNVSLELSNTAGELLQIRDTDIDGYYEFNGLTPGQYQLVIAQTNLQEKGYTAEVIGYSILTGGKGGYSELPAMKLHQIAKGDLPAAEEIKIISLDAENTEAVVWDDDPNKRQNYFTLPTKDKVMAKHSLTQAIVAPQVLQSEKEIDGKDEIKEVSPPAPVTGEAVINGFSLLSKNSSTNGLPTVSIRPNNKRKVIAKALPPIEPVNQTITTTSNLPEIGKEFAIQLGAYTDRKYAQKLIASMTNEFLKIEDFNIIDDVNAAVFRLTYGSFTSSNQAMEFARQYMPQNQSYFVRKKQTLTQSEPESPKVQLPDTGWVIQFYASDAPIVRGPITAKYSAIGSLYLATKANTSNDGLYYLVSQVYTSKQAALQALGASGLKGWVTSNSSHTSIKEL